MTPEEMRAFVVTRVLARLSGSGERRNAALRDVLGFAAPHLDDDTLRELAPLVPELPARLYEKWAGMFADRLLETVPAEQIRDLCQGTKESDASLLLVYAMFMESERMEKVVADDLKALAAQGLSTKEKARLLAAHTAKSAKPVIH